MRALALALVLFVLPFGLRLLPIGHGAPHSYVPDTHIVRNALGMAQDKDLVPPMGKYSSYPYLLPYTLLPVYAAQYAFARATGAVHGVGEFKARIMEEPIRAHLPARIVLASLAALAALGAFGAARAAGLARGAWIAAWLAGTCLLHVHMSTHERPWAPLATALLFTAWPAIRYVRTGERRALLWSGLAAGVAFGISQAGIAALGMGGVAWWLGCPPIRAGVRALAAHARLGFATVAVCLLVAIPLGHGYWVRYGPTERSQVAAAELVTEDDSTLMFGGTQIPLGFRAATFTNLARTFFGYDPALCVLGLAGLGAWLFGGRERRRALAPLVLFALAWGGFFMTNPNEHVRYILPLATLLVLPASLVGERLAGHSSGRVILALALAVPLVQAARLVTVLRREDTRALALTRLAELPEGSRVAIDMYGPTPPRDAASLATTAALRELYGRERHRQLYYEAGAAPPGAPGVDALGLEDLFEYDLRHGGTWLRERALSVTGSAREALEAQGIEPARAALAALGVTHVLLVDRTPDDGRRPPLVDPTPARPREGAPAGAPAVPKLAPLQLAAAPLWVIAPNAPGRLAQDGHLPTELRFPLRDLWTIERPGPWLGLYALPR